MELSSIIIIILVCTAFGVPYFYLVKQTEKQILEAKKKREEEQLKNTLPEETKRQAVNELFQWMTSNGISFNQSEKFEKQCPTIWNLIKPED